jgi:hypothetical protein
MMDDRLGRQRFASWRENPQPQSFEARLMAEWLQWRCACWRKDAETAMQRLSLDADLCDLVAATFEHMGVAPTPMPPPRPRRGWASSSSSSPPPASQATPEQPEHEISAFQWPLPSGHWDGK